MKSMTTTRTNNCSKIGRTHATKIAALANACVGAAMPVALVLCGLSVMSPLMTPSSALAQSAAVMEKSPLDRDVEDFWHFAKIGRYDAAKVKADAIIAAGSEPLVLLTSFEKVASARGDDLTQWMLRYESVAAIKEQAGAIQKTLADGRFARRSDPNFIDQQIQRLNVNQIAYENGLRNLKSSGELAVPQLLNYLKSPDKSAFHASVRKALRDLGKDALNPLVAATELTDNDTLAQVIAILGESGYADVAPYLERLSSSPKSTGPVKEAALIALGRLGVSPTGAGQGFHDLAEKFYTGKSSIAFDNRNPLANVWYYNQELGLEKREVPHAVYAEIMTLRSAEYALEIQDGSEGELATKSLALWLVANYKREVELAGAADPTRGTDQPKAHYYGVTSGTSFLDLALTRAIADGDAAVAFEIIRSQQEIAGPANTDLSKADSALIAAMQYPDRRVRFEAAFAVADARKAGVAFDGADLVVPLLGEAISQTGQTSVLIISATTDAANALVEPIKAGGGVAAVVTSAADVATSAAGLPSVDVVVLTKDVSPETANSVLVQLASSPKLRGAARLVQTETTQSAFEQLKLSDKLLTTTVTTDPAALVTEINAANAKVGSVPVDPAVATEYATRAGTRLVQLGAIAPAELPVIKGTLLQSLANDTRPEVVSIVGDVLALLDDVDAQSQLFAKANADATPAELRVSLFKSLAKSAKLHGSKLSESDVAALEKAVIETQDLAVRAAAAEARGGLNLPAAQARNVVLKQVQR